MKKIQDQLQNELGLHPSLGSKMGYRTQYPNRNPLFNATIMARHPDSGELVRVWYGDLEMTRNLTLETLKAVSKSNKTSLFIYRESTINNVVFNGGVFPYSEFEFHITDIGQIINK